MSLLYIDTNVIIDAIKGRRNKFGKRIGNPASDLFFNAILCKHKLIISTWALKELDDNAFLQDAKMFFELTKKKIEYLKYNDEDKQKAKQKSQDKSDDALHIVLAEKYNADYIVTRNKDHFQDIQTAIPIKKPEELL